MKVFTLIRNKFYADLLRSNWYKRQVKQNPRRALNIKWHANYHKPFPFDNPQNLDEKIGWLQINTDTSLWSRLADKYTVRGYVKERGLEDILIPCYGVWDKVEDIDFNCLPSSFVIKCTHDCGSTQIIHDKSKADLELVKENLKKCMVRTMGYSTFEPHYHEIQPRIIAEKLLGSDERFQSTSIVDYKIWCLDGEPYCALVCYDRENTPDGHGSVIFDLYSINPWKPIREKLSPMMRNQKFRDVPQPENYEELLSVARTLSKDIPQVRLDLYIINGKTYFSEMTMTASGGINYTYSQEILLEMGKRITLPKRNG